MPESILRVEIANSAGPNRTGEVHGQIDVEILSGGAFAADSLVSCNPSTSLCVLSRGKLLEEVGRSSGVLVAKSADSAQILQVLVDFGQIVCGGVVIRVGDNGLES